MLLDDALRRRMEVISLIEDTPEANLSAMERELKERYNLNVRYLDTNGRHFSYPELRVVVLGDNTQSDARYFSLLHEIGHVESDQPPKGDGDPFQVLCWEAEAWRWAYNEAKRLGHNIPRDQIRRSIETYVESFIDSKR